MRKRGSKPSAKAGKATEKAIDFRDRGGRLTLANDFRAVVESDWYRRIFPGTRIGRFKNTETEIEFTERGYRLAVSVQGTLTGRGGDLIIIDDPIKPDRCVIRADPQQTSTNGTSTRS